MNDCDPHLKKNPLFLHISLYLFIKIRIKKRLKHFIPHAVNNGTHKSLTVNYMMKRNSFSFLYVLCFKADDLTKVEEGEC